MEGGEAPRARRRSISDWGRIGVVLVVIGEVTMLALRPVDLEWLLTVGLTALVGLPWALRVVMAWRAVEVLRRDLARANPDALVLAGLAAPALGSALTRLGVAHGWPEAEDATEGDAAQAEAEAAVADAIMGLVVGAGRLGLRDRAGREVVSFPAAHLAPATVALRPGSGRARRVRCCVVLRFADQRAELPFSPGAQTGPPLPAAALGAAEAAAAINRALRFDPTRRGSPD
ncbi:MAG: hypothetical protein LBD51_08655 [Bifidobacteriaceae bacterium]|nr:hypothetical protein [Bifidobacteriaceae bacterium]